MRKIVEIFSFLILVISLMTLMAFIAGCEKKETAKVEELQVPTRRIFF